MKVIDADGNSRVIDGPFAESKELVAGYSNEAERSHLLARASSS